MQNNIDRGLKTMFLRRKLQRIEVKRAEGSKLGIFINRLRYPRTDRGRKRFIKDSLNPGKNYHCKLIFAILILTGIAGLIVSLVLCFKGIGLWLLAVLSMLIIVVGIQGIERRDDQ